MKIRLITPAELEALPDGTELIDINGGRSTKGKNRIDGDTRFGYLAYGVPAEPGFTGPNSWTVSNRSGLIMTPRSDEQSLAGDGRDDK